MKEKKDRPGVSAILVIHNEEKLIRRALESIKNVVDEILILHDGPCSDKSLKIAREYTKNVFTTKKNVGLPGPILPILFRKVKYEWILKIDTDEVISTELAKAIPELIQNPNVNAYTVLWPFTDKNKKNITKNWPRKLSLYRKSKMHYFGFPHWDDPQIDGNIVDTKFILHHYPPKGSIPSWKEIKEKGLGRYVRLSAEYTLKPFDSFDSFQYDKTDFPIYFKIRREFPLLSIIPMTIIATLKNYFKNGAYKEGWPALVEVAQDLISYPYMGYLIWKLKRNQKCNNKR
jgi:glycosyltransferase involved in cell wall biosynthesis